MVFTSKITDEQRAQVLKWAAEGMTYSQIAENLNGAITRQRVEQLCKKAGVNPASIRKKRMLEEQEAKRKVRLGSFYKESDDDVDHETWAIAYEKFKNKRSHGHWNFDLEFSHVEFSKVCPILGIELDYKNSGRENSAEFDRIDSTEGYIPGNVWIISRRANRVKNDGTAEEHRLISNAMKARGVW